MFDDLNEYLRLFLEPRKYSRPYKKYPGDNPDFAFEKNVL